MMTTTAYRHVQCDPAGVAWIDDTNTKVVEVVALFLAYGWDGEQIQRALPHLSLAQIHSALAFYYDHQRQMDEEIEQRLGRADDFFTRHANSALQLKLRAAKEAAKNSA